MTGVPPSVEDAGEPPHELDVVVRKPTHLADRVSHRGHLGATRALDREDTRLASFDQVDRRVAEARRPQAVDRGGGATALEMTKDHLSSLDPGPLFDVPREDGADRALIQTDVAECVTVQGRLRLRPRDGQTKGKKFDQQV